MPFKIIGDTTGGIAEIETNSKAARAVSYPGDFNVCGSYSMWSQMNPIGSPSPATTSIIWAAFQWISETHLCALKQIQATLRADTSGSCVVKAIAARGFITQYNAGTIQAFQTVTGNQQKRRTNMQASSPNNWSVVFINDRGTPMTGNVSTLDAAPFAAVAGSQATNRIGPSGDIYRVEPGEYPMILNRFEGFELQLVVPTVIAIETFAAGISWDELENY